MTNDLPAPGAQASEQTHHGLLWHRYVAIGDSFTEGMSDHDPREDDAYLGWADRLAVDIAMQQEERGAKLEYANLAVRGRLLADVIGPQLDAALAMKPDLVSMVGGGNDIMRPNVDLDDVADQLEAAVVRLKDAGADVMLATMVNPTGSKIMTRLRPRISWHIANLWGIAQRHDCYVLDVWGMRALRDMRMWGADRLHLSPEGHRRVAQQAANKTNIGVGVHVHLQVHSLAQFLVVQGKKTFQHHHAPRQHAGGLGRAGVQREIVLRHFNGYARQQRVHMLAQQRPVEGRRVVVIRF